MSEGKGKEGEEEGREGEGNLLAFLSFNDSLVREHFVNGMDADSKVSYYSYLFSR